MAQTDQIKKGMYILYNNEPYFITDAEFYSPGKGAAFTRVKMKNLNNSRVIPFTFKSGEKVEEMYVNMKDMQYLYSDDTKLFFMDPSTYEQLELNKAIVENYVPFMKDGNEYTVILDGDKILTLKFPPQVVLTITETSDAVKGDTSSNATKDAIVETGARIQVPLFVKVGDKVKVDTESAAYQGRATVE